MKKLFTLILLLPNILSAQTINTYAGNGINGYSGDGGSKTSAAIGIAGGLAKDASGNIYIGGFTNNTIRKILPSGVITTYAGNGTSGYSGDGGPATNATLSGPVKIAMDGSGNLYIAEQYNHVIRKITSAGIISTFAGTGISGYSGDGGMASLAKLDQPTGVCTDATGNVYVADLGNNRIRKISSSGTITTVAGTGTPGSAGDGGNATSAQLHLPFGVTIDNLGNMYIAEPGNHKIRKVNTSGIISTFAGTGSAGFSGDGGQATAAVLNNVAGVLTDTSGNVYIADQLNNRIRKISPSGIITTIVGNGILGFSGDGGPATSAQLSGSNEMMFNLSGNLLLTDNENYRVRIISMCGNNITSQPIPDTVNLGGNAIYTVTTSMLAPSYQWQENSGAGFVNLTNVLPYSGVNTNTLVIHNVIMLFNNTHYRCIVSNETLCTDTTNGPILIVRDNTGIDEEVANKIIDVYPNPSHDKIVIKLPHENATGNVRIFNEIGQILSEQPLTINNNSISLADYAVGMYILRLEYDGVCFYKRIFKK